MSPSLLAGPLTLCLVFLPPSCAADAFKRLPDGNMPPLFGAILNSAVIGIYDGLTPVSTAVFFSPTRALTAHHDAKPVVGTVLTGASSPAEEPVRQWEFKVVASSPLDDLVVLEIVSGPTPTHFLPVTGNPSITSLRDTKLWLATFGISAAKMAAEYPTDIHLGSFRQTVKVNSFGAHHFSYHINTGRGDSGGALISKSGQLVGLHLGGWNDSSPPPSPEKEGAAAAGAGSAAAAAAGGQKARAGSGKKASGSARAAGKKAGTGAGGAAAAGGGAGAGDIAAKIKNRERALAMGLEKVGTASRKSIIKLATQLTAGGYALYLGSPAIAALCSAPSAADEGAGGGSSGGSGAGGGGATAGKKRKPAGGDAGGASGGGAGGGGGAVKKRK